MKARELKDLFPRPEFVQAYQAVGQKYEYTIHDRSYKEWLPLITANVKLKDNKKGER